MNTDEALGAADTRFALVAEPELGLATRPTCSCKHPFAGSGILADGEPWGYYYVEAGPPGELFYTVEMFDVGPAAREWQGPRVSFRARYGPVDGHVAYSLMGVRELTAPDVFTELEREEGLAHARIRDLWEALDWLYLVDPMMHQVVHHGVHPTPRNWPPDAGNVPARPRRRLFRRGPK